MTPTELRAKAASIREQAKLEAHQLLAEADLLEFGIQPGAILKGQDGETLVVHSIERAGNETTVVGEVTQITRVTIHALRDYWVNRQGDQGAYSRPFSQPLNQSSS